MHAEPIETKRCTRCGKVLPFPAAYGKSGRRNGRQRYRAECKQCGAARSAAYRAVHPTYDRDYRAANRDRCREQGRAWRAANPCYDKAQGNPGRPRHTSFPSFAVGYSRRDLRDD